VTQPPRDARTVPCPACGRTALYAPSNPHRPFCSERCRVTDLGAWASESFRVPGGPAEGAQQGDDEASRGS
jgi:uncharacterized protein